MEEVAGLTMIAMVVRSGWRRWLLLFALLAAAAASPAAAQSRAPLEAIRPQVDCQALARVDLTTAAGARVSASATLVETDQGRFCQVKGTVAPAIGFEVDLPTARWTQRFLQAGCGGLCGTINASIGNAGKCLPATNGEFVVAASDLGHQAAMGSPTEGDFAADPQKRIDFAYRANHLTALVGKALIRAYYGRAPRYSYFSGCSDGGREAMMEAERYPDDFDGISAGAPAMLFQVQNSFWHAWTTAANLRPDGSRILAAAKLLVLHAAVLAHCDTLDGNRDGLLSDPRLCRVDPAWTACKAGTPNAADCLTQEEWSVAARIYAGPSDDAGHRFPPGGAQPGSELMWNFIDRGRGDGGGPGGGSMLANMSKVVYADPTAQEASPSGFPFTLRQFARANALHPLNDATDTALGPFARHGGKLVMWHGWSDTSIAPMTSVAYYETVRREMGAASTDAFFRLFMLPGVGHCGGGDGFPQFDTLTGLMAWVEGGVAPDVMVADKVADAGAPPFGAGDRSGPPPGGPGGGFPGGPEHRVPMSGRMPFAASGGPDGRGGMPGVARPTAPYARVDRPAVASRPIYAFPSYARYTGTGDPAASSAYAAALGEQAGVPAWLGAPLISPHFQRSYAVTDGVIHQE